MATVTTLRRWRSCWQQRAPRNTVPERPRLAPGIELCGKLAESGFSQQQWLAQRDGRYLQLTELIYRVAELCDGEHTVQEIADRISVETGKRISDASIRHLVKRKLIPSGLALPSSVAATDVAAARRSAPASPLGVQAKMAVVGPRVIDPLSAAFRFLYWPPLVFVVLGAGTAALRWVFVVHGIGAGLYQVLYQPALLLAMIGLVVASAAFHELGHAAALRYGGGRVRCMGFGFYLVYPAFYTDVSDNYRLGRWARVRTDLGGFYFNLIFILATIGIFVLTGWEFLLIVVVAIVFDIVRQLMPFVRLDGYWTLADITGIPDFFSNIGPFVRSLLPLRFWSGRKLPPLKPWVKAIYALYLLITLPLLLFVLFAMLRSTPRILATAWDSLRAQGMSFSLAWGRGDGWSVAAAAVQALILALPTAGTLLLFTTLGRTVFRGIWRLARPTPLRRIGGALATAGLAVLLLFLWAPQVPAAIPAFGGEAGPLYRTTKSAFNPITSHERGVVGDVIPDTLSVPGISDVDLFRSPASPTPATAPAIPLTATTPDTPQDARSATATATSTPESVDAQQGTPTMMPTVRAPVAPPPTRGAGRGGATRAALPETQRPLPPTRPPRPSVTIEQNASDAEVATAASAATTPPTRTPARTAVATGVVDASATQAPSTVVPRTQAPASTPPPTPPPPPPRPPAGQLPTPPPPPPTPTPVPH